MSFTLYLWVVSMNEQRLTNVSLKLLGVYCALKAVERFHGLVVVSMTTDYFMWSHLASLLIFLSCSFILIRYSQIISTKFFPFDRNNNEGMKVSEVNWLDVGIFLIGAGILVLLVPNKIGIIAHNIFIRSLATAPDYIKNSARIDVWIGCFQTVIYLVLGVVLLFKSKSAALFFKKEPPD